MHAFSKHHFVLTGLEITNGNVKQPPHQNPILYIQTQGYPAPHIRSHLACALCIYLFFRHPDRLLPKVYWLSYLNKWPTSSICSN